MADINLLRFCANGDDPRRFLQYPFVYEGWDVASNGHMIIFCDKHKHSCYPYAPDTFMPVINQVLSDIERGNFVEMPHVDLPILQDCKYCDGSGITFLSNSICDDCMSEGFLVFDYGRHNYVVDCKECNGDGIKTTKESAPKSCFGCLGVGQYLGARRQPILVELLTSAFKINAMYVKKIASLPGLKIAPGNGGEGIAFTFEGGFGLVLGVRPT